MTDKAYAIQDVCDKRLRCAECPLIEFCHEHECHMQFEKLTPQQADEAYRIMFGDQHESV
jgi:hypothetical protein